MPVFVLRAKANLEGVKRFWVPTQAVWDLDLQQSAGTETRQGVEVDPEAQVEIPNSKNALANLLIKWPGDKNYSYLKLVDVPKLVRQQVDEDTDLVPIAAFECRGLEPVRWNPTGGYCAEASSGVTYDSVGFRDGEDWCEYDEKSGESLFVGKDIEHVFEVHR